MLRGRTVFLLAVVALVLAAAPAIADQDERAEAVPGTAPPEIAPAVTAAVPASPVAPFVTATGPVSLSVDAVGTNDPDGAPVLVDKPEGATVLRAYLMAASTGFTDYEPQDGDVTIGGAPVAWEPARTMVNGIRSVNVWADVTSLLKGPIDAAPSGLLALNVAEGAVTFLIDGAILAIIFEDPNVDVPATVVLAYGAQQVTGDRIRLVRPAEIPSEDVEVRLGVGISYGFQPTFQDNTVNVNGVRLTSSAGGQDDGEGANGALITVGGIGDLPDNPPDPFARGNQFTCPRCDDELYDLQPFLAGGPISDLELTTMNPSADDNFFFAALEVVGATATWTPASDRIPLVVLHGITGSFLEDGDGNEVWPDEGRTADSLNDGHLDVLKLADNGIDPADPDDEISVSTGRGIGGIIGETELCTPIFCKHLADAYQPMFDKLRDDYSYLLGTDLFPFAFDWRLSAAVNGERLIDFIDGVLAQTGAGKVNIVAHSQGGLVTRAALENGRSIGKVERVATLGTPNLGATKLHGVLDLRQPCQADAPVGCFLNRRKAQELVTNWPGALELLPSRGFFDTYTSSIRRDIDDDGDGRVEGLLPFAEVRAQLADRNLALIDAATALHLQIDEWDPADPAVDLLRMVGIDSSTIVRIRQFLKEKCSGFWWWRECRLVETFEFEMDDGDGTVPRRSASLLGPGIDLSGGANVCNVWGRDTGHGDLPNNDLVLAITLDFLERDEFRCEARDTLALNSTAAHAATIDTSVTNAGETGVELAATELLVRGSVTGYVERVGSGLEDVMGIIDDGSGPVEIEGIDGGSYVTAPESVSFSFTNNDDYRGTWMATQTGEVVFLVRTYEGGPAAVASTRPFVVAAGAGLALGFSHPADPFDAAVEIDDDGDGIPDRSVPFDVTVSGPGAADTIAPTSAVAVRRFPEGKRDMAEVTITATDDTSGVAFIEYALDAGEESSAYGGPFVVPALGELYVRAWDNAGNVEAPYQVVVLDDHPSRPDLVEDFLTVPFNEPGLLGYEGDVDYWGLRIAEPGPYMFRLVGLQADYDLRLLDADGAEIGVGAQRGNRSETVRALLAPGDYLLEVRGFAGAFSLDHRYRLLGVATG